jgi:hypothetical protein
MRRAALPALLALALVCVTVAAAGRGEIVLFDAPKGSWLGALSDEAPLVVLEERDGWRHVRLEGWIMDRSEAPAAGKKREAAPQPAAAATGGASTIAAPARQTTVQGLLSPPMGAGGSAGAGVLVLLVGESAALDALHRKAGAECRARLDRKDHDIESLRAEVNRALNSSDNFREAAGRSDEVKNRLATGQRERQDLVRECRSRAQAVFEPSVVQRALSDGNGRFDFHGIAPGRYRVVAFETSGDSPRAWSFVFDLGDGETRVLDPSTDRSPVPADWGLR